MTTAIEIVSAGLSVLVPLLVIRTIVLTGRRMQGAPAGMPAIIVAIVAWTAAVWIAGTLGWVGYREGDSIPRFLVPLFMPVIGFAGLMASRSGRQFMDAIGLDQLVGFQFWRVFGGIFMLVALAGLGPQDLMYSGLGDLLTGTMAIIAYFMVKVRHSLSRYAVWIATGFGIADLLGILFILLSNYPIWSPVRPSSALAGEFPMVLIVGLAAPAALVFHIMTIRKLLLHNTERVEIAKRTAFGEPAYKQ